MAGTPTLARSAFTIWSTIDSAAALPVCVPPPFGRPMVRPGDGGGVGGVGELLAIPGSGAFAGGCAVGLPVGPPYGSIAGSVVVCWLAVRVPEWLNASEPRNVTAPSARTAATVTAIVRHPIRRLAGSSSEYPSREYPSSPSSPKPS